METVTLNRKQQRRAEVLARLDAGSITKSDACHLLGVSRRQVDRMLNSYRERGIGSVVHGNTGRAPTNKTDAAVIEAIERLCCDGGKYEGFNTCHTADMLSLYEHIRIGRSTLGRIMSRSTGKSVGSHPVVRRKRDRSAAEGMMLQIDGSPHDWLEGRGPRMTLMGAIDDAKGKIIHLRFHRTEDQTGYLMMMRDIAITHGLPGSFYHDRHTMLRSPKAATIEDELEGQEPMSQLERVMASLGVESIAAHSPQAKGRIERLWGVLQDRLVKEMRIAAVNTMEDANCFLPDFISRFNTRFARPAADPQTAWVEMGPGTDIDYYFSIREDRVVRSDQTISFYGRTFQIQEDRCSAPRPGSKVNVHTTPEGDIYIYQGKRRLQYRQAERTTLTAKTQQRPKLAPEDAAKSEAKRRAWLFGKERERSDAIMSVT